MATASNFRITIHNGTNDEVKATRFEYRDGPAWRTEAMFGLDGHQKIEKGHGIVFTRDLEGVGGEETQFRVTYQHRAGGTVWGSDKSAVTEPFTCNDNGSRTVTLTT